MDATGNKIKIWAEDVQLKDGSYNRFYSTSFYSKNQDGSYLNAYVDVRFPRNTGKIHNGTEIDIKRGFWTARKGKDGYGLPVIMVQEFDIVGAPQTEGYMAVQDDDIPF